MTDVIQVATTIDTEEGARQIAQSLVSGRLAACVHIIGPISSTYWWRGNMETAQEWTCVAKTRKDLYEDVEKAIRAIHPYEVPDIVATPVLTGSATYLEWIVNETVKHTKASDI
jgi:periplasmic divalent cation tolerance protein